MMDKELENELKFNIEKIRQITGKDNDLRDSRITRLEKQYDTMSIQINDMALQNRDILGMLKVTDERIKDFIKVTEKYIESHNNEHCRLQDTDEALKKYMFIAMGAIGILSFIAPFLWDLWLKR